MSYKSCAICHKVETPICNHCIGFDKFEKSEWAKDFESEIRADQTTQTINDLISILKARHKDDNAWCEYDIDTVIKEIEDIAEQTKGV